MNRNGKAQSGEVRTDSAENWERVFNSVQDLIVILDAENRILDANPAVMEALGLRKDQITGRRCYSLFHCSDEPPRNCPYETLKKSLHQESFSMEMEALGRSFLVTVSPIYDNLSHRLSKVVHIAKDITEMKKTEAALMVSEKKFQSIFQAASDGILLARIGKKEFVDANEAICEMLGYTRDELLQLTVSDIHPRDDLPRVLEVFGRQAKGERGVVSMLPVQRKDGSVFYAEISARPVQLGGQDYLVGIFRDATSRFQYEQTIKVEKETAQRYLDVAGVMLVALNTVGEITLINQRGCELLSVDEKDALGKNWFAHFLPERVRKDVGAVFAQLIAGNITPVEYYENPILTSTGEERIVAFHNSLLSDAAGRITGVLVSGEDITEATAATKELQAEKEFVEHAIHSQ